jgi:hypothetical protein
MLWRDPSGLIVIDNSCSAAAQERLREAERQVQRKLDSSCGGCSEGNTGCIPCNYLDKLRVALQTTKVSCLAANSPPAWCAQAATPGSTIEFFPLGFQPNCSCLQATLLHELLHNIGLGGGQHPEINFIEKRCFGNDCKPLPVDRGYGPFTPPSQDY